MQATAFHSIAPLDHSILKIRICGNTTHGEHPNLKAKDSKHQVKFWNNKMKRGHFI
jgi:hypothetical protein